MSQVYEICPTFENSKYLLRFAEREDVPDLLEVYSDKNALPFFNSDNCHGDNFYYPTLEAMDKAMDFWLMSYKERYFVRWTIIDKDISKAIGTIEMFHRQSDDDFDNAAVIRLDVRSDYEKCDELSNILGLIIPPAYDMFDCNEIISKVPIYAIERMKAFKNSGFEKSDSYMIGSNDHYAYKDYWKVVKH